MGGIMTGLGRVGGGIAVTALALGMLAGAIFIGTWTHEKTGKAWAGWIAGISAFVFLALIFGPVMEAAQSVSCRGMADYQACMDPDDD